MGRVVCIRVGSLAVAIHNAYLLSRLGRLGRGLATLSALPVAAGLLAASAPLLARAGRSTICCAHPSDDLLIRRFAAHRQEFDRLVAMSQADARVFRVAPDFTRLEDDWVGPGPTLSWDSRLNAGGNTGGSLPGSTLGPALNGGGKGLTRRHIARLYPGDGTGGSTKGYVYSPTTRVPRTLRWTAYLPICRAMLLGTDTCQGRGISSTRGMTDPTAICPERSRT